MPEETKSCPHCSMLDASAEHIEQECPLRPQGGVEIPPEVRMVVQQLMGAGGRQSADPNNPDHITVDLPVPVSLAAVAKASIGLIDRVTGEMETDHKEAERSMFATWMIVDECIREYATHPSTPAIKPEQMAAILFIREYFKHAGNWPAMRSCLQKAAEHPDPPGPTIHLVRVRKP